MSRYRFRLETVLRVRRTEEERARHSLRAANTTLRAALDRHDRAAARYRAFADGARAVCTVDELVGERLHAGILAGEVAGAHRRAMGAANDAALARVQWSTAARRVAILERLDERRRAEHANEEQHAEAALVDDIVTSRYHADLLLEEEA